MRWSPEVDDSAIPKSQGHTPGHGQVFGTRTTPREPEKGRRLYEVYGAMLHRGTLSSGRSSVAHDPRPALAIQRPPRPPRPVEHRL